MRSLLVGLGLLACACGEVTNRLPDAPPGGGSDGGDVPVRGTVNVTVLDPSGTGAPAIGANVVFLDPDGTLVKRVTTDGAGKASAEVLPGGNVTSVVPVNTAQFQMQTVLAIKPGDNIVLGAKTLDTADAGTFTVSYPPFGGAASYSVVGSCGGVTIPSPVGAPPVTSGQISLLNHCKQTTMELVVVPHDGNGNPLATIAKAGVTFVPNGSATITGNYQSLRSFTASYTNTNPAVTNLSLLRGVPDATFGFSTSVSVPAPPASSVQSLTGAIASSGEVSTGLASTTAGSSQTLRQKIGGGAATYGLDVGAMAMPWIGRTSLDLANHKIVAPVDTTGTSTEKFDLVRVTTSYSRVEGGATTQFTWNVFGPSAGDVVLPVIPVEAGDVMPRPTDTPAKAPPTVTAFDADTVTGYDAVRNDPNAAMTQFTVGLRSAANLIRISRFQSKI